MIQLAGEFVGKGDNNLKNILCQAARELLLLEASDWQFLISTWSARDYAEIRAAKHFESFRRLANMARQYGRGENVEQEDWTFLGDCEARDALFPDVDPKWWKELDFPAK